MDGGTLDMCVGDFTTSQVLIGCFPNTFKITKSHLFTFLKPFLKSESQNTTFSFKENHNLTSNKRKMANREEKEII